MIIGQFFCREFELILVINGEFFCSELQFILVNFGDLFEGVLGLIFVIIWEFFETELKLILVQQLQLLRRMLVYTDLSFPSAVLQHPTSRVACSVLCTAVLAIITILLLKTSTLHSDSSVLPIILDNVELWASLCWNILKLNLNLYDMK